jgi:azurin
MFRKLAIVSLLSLATSPVWAADCKVEVDSTDQMTFSTTAIEISKSCKTFTVDLKHSGALPKNVMGHNWVLTRASDMQGALDDGMTAGLDNDYLKAGDSRVIAHTKVIGAGETDSVTFDTAKLSGNDYVFFCSFPGHAAMMKGTVKRVD